MKIGYLGPVGTFSHYALSEYAEKNLQGFDLHPVASIPQLFSDFSTGLVDDIFVPVENSIEGSVTSTMDLLVGLESGQIADELVYSVSHVLMTKQGDDTGAIKTILSHAQPLGQCRAYVAKMYPDAELKLELSTAAAAQKVSDAAGGLAVIGHKALAAQYGLIILDTDIQDHSQNFTRFIRVNKETTLPTGDDKTSIVFSAQRNKSGSLVAILSLFSEAGINLTRIVSRPLKTRLGEYLFFVDCEGHYKDETLDAVLATVALSVKTYSCLGSYKKRGE